MYEYSKKHLFTCHKQYENNVQNYGKTKLTDMDITNV